MTVQAPAERDVDLRGEVADRRTCRAWNRDTAAVMCLCSKRDLTFAVGRAVGA